MTWFYDVDQTSQFALNQATMQVPGLAGQLRTTWQLSADRRTLTADFASPAIAQRNWTQVTNLYGGYDAWDSFYFAGYAPPPPAPLPTAPSYGPVPVPSVPSPVPSVQSPAPSASAAASDPIVLTSANAVAAFKGYLTRKYKTIFTKATDSYVRCANIFEDADSGDQLGDCYAEFGTGKSWRLVIASPQAKYDATSVTIAPNPFVRAWRRVFRKAGATCLRNQGDPIKGTLYSNSFGCDARMASEIYKGVTGWHGTGTGSFLPVTRYTCHKGGRTYTCANKMGDAFRWTPRRATAKRGAASTPKPRRKKKAHRSPAPSGCDPNYSGCLKPNVSDYDCAGGSGDGPYYTGPVRVKGNDHYDLDRDGDGLACETS